MMVAFNVEGEFSYLTRSLGMNSFLWTRFVQYYKNSNI